MEKIKEIAKELCIYSEEWAEECINVSKLKNTDLSEYECPMHVVLESDNCAKCPLIDRDILTPVINSD